MVRFLITPTLLNSFSFYKKYEGEREAEIRQDFLNTLSREKFEPNEAMLKGIKFEQDVENYCNGKFSDKGIFDPINGSNQMTAEEEKEYLKYKPYADCVKQIGDICKDGLWQASVKKEIAVDDQPYLLYGKCDVIKQDSIFDIKRTSSYDLGKYQESAQHRIYLYCSNLPQFSYLISNGREWWKEDYYNHSEIEQEIKFLITEFISHLDYDEEARRIYFDKWGSKQ